jgi:hypothetical protein
VAASASSVQIMPIRQNASYRCVFNNGSTDLFLYFNGGAATTTSFNVKVVAGGFYEFGTGSGGVYNGQVNGIWSGSPTGNAMVTDY